MASQRERGRATRDEHGASEQSGSGTPDLHASDATEWSAAPRRLSAKEIRVELHLAATNRQKAGMNCKCPRRSVTNAPAVHAAIRAVRRNRLAMRASAAYSSFHRSTPITRTKGPNMKAISTQVRLTSLLLAVLMSATVLGATVAGMQSSGASSYDVVVLEQVTVRPTAVQ
jgi:hypothetical protein